MLCSKSQYETQFKKWDFNKRKKGEDWKIVGYKTDKRKQQGKATSLYFNGSLMPQKNSGGSYLGKVTSMLRKVCSGLKVSILTYFEASAGLTCAAPTPNTPAGFDIRTPAASYPPFHLLLENLPLFRLCTELEHYSSKCSIQCRFWNKQTNLLNVSSSKPCTGWMALRQCSV